jgi:hypothetical protein
VVVVMPQYRVSRYAVWQYKGVDASGHFRPLVISTSEGAYYLYSGKPYLTPTVRMGNYIPFVTD